MTQGNLFQAKVGSINRAKFYLYFDLINIKIELYLNKICLKL